MFLVLPTETRRQHWKTPLTAGRLHDALSWAASTLFSGAESAWNQYYASVTENDSDTRPKLTGVDLKRYDTVKRLGAYGASLAYRLSENPHNAATRANRVEAHEVLQMYGDVVTGEDGHTAGEVDDLQTTVLVDVRVVVAR